MGKLAGGRVGVCLQRRNGETEGGSVCSVPTISLLC